MDKNSVIGIVLIAAILVLWGILQTPSREELARRQDMSDSLSRAGDQQLAGGMMTDSLSATASLVPAERGDTATSDLKDAYGDFAVAASGEQMFHTLENDLVRITISTKGGRPYSAELKQYSTFDGKPVVLFSGDSTQFGLRFYHKNKAIETNELYFAAVNPSPSVTVSEKRDSLVMRLALNSESYLDYIYALDPESYMVDFTMALKGMDKVIDASVTNLDLEWESYIPAQEQVRKNENQYTTIYYRHYQEEVSFFNARSNREIQQENISTGVEWVAFKNQFFSSVLIAENSFSNALLQSTAMPEGDLYLKNFRAELGLPFGHSASESLRMHLFFGPNKFSLLKKYGDFRLEDIVSVGKGIIRWINQFVIIPIFDWLSRFIGNYGIIILLLTIIIKVVLLPLTYRSYLSQAKMKVLKPQVDELNKKYPQGKEMEKQQATMALYKKAGVSPMGGCFPMLLQFPILFAMFRFFPTSIELRQQGFLWAKDLSTYDAIVSWNANIPIISNIYGNHISLFTLLMTLSTILSMKLSDTSASSQQMPGMKAMMYVMPVMFMFMLNSWSAGLTYYYFLTNVITIGQNYLFKSFVNEEALLKKMKERKAQPAKKSKFQQRLEEMARQQASYRAPKKK